METSTQVVMSEGERLGGSREVGWIGMEKGGRKQGAGELEGTDRRGQHQETAQLQFGDATGHAAYWEKGT